MKMIEDLLHKFLPVKSFLQGPEAVFGEPAAWTELLDFRVSIQVYQRMVKVKNCQDMLFP